MPLLHPSSHQGSAAWGRQRAGADGGDLGGGRDARRRRLRPCDRRARRRGAHTRPPGRLTPAPPAPAERKGSGPADAKDIARDKRAAPAPSTTGRSGSHGATAATARSRSIDLAGHALAGAARERRVRATRARVRRHRRDLQPDDLCQGDHELGPLRRPAPGAGRAGARGSPSAFPRARARGHPPGGGAASAHLRAERRSRWVHLARVHAGPGRRRRWNDRAGA